MYMKFQDRMTYDDWFFHVSRGWGIWPSFTEFYRVSPMERCSHAATCVVTWGCYITVRMFTEFHNSRTDQKIATLTCSFSIGAFICTQPMLPSIFLNWSTQIWTARDSGTNGYRTARIVDRADEYLVLPSFFGYLGPLNLPTAASDASPFRWSFFVNNGPNLAPTNPLPKNHRPVWVVHVN